MIYIKRFALILSFILILAPGLSAQEDSAPDSQSGNFLYKMPSDWKHIEKGDSTYLFAPAPPRGTTTFIDMTTDDLDGDLLNSFNQLWGGIKKSYHVLKGGQIAPFHAKKGFDAFYASAVVSDQKGKRWSLSVVGAQYGKRIQTVTFMSDLPPGSTLNAYLKAFQTFLSTLSFGDALPGSKVPAAGNSTPADSSAARVPSDSAASEKTHKLPPGALDGFYVGFYRKGGIYGSGSHVELRRLCFSPDGWVVKDVPQEGMIGFDFTAYRNSRDTNRSWVGRYHVDGNKINIVWQDYAEDRELIERNERSGKPALDVYVPMCRCTTKKFSGKYKWGLQSSGQYLQFFPDGTFVDHQVLDQMLVPSPYYNHPRIQRGTYAIQSQTMIFTFQDGRRGTRTFIAPKAQESGQIFDWIGLGWHTLYEEHYQDEP